MQSTRVASVDIGGRGAPVALDTFAVIAFLQGAEISRMALAISVTRIGLISVADCVVLWVIRQALGTVPVATARINASIVILVLPALNLAIATEHQSQQH